MINYLSSSTKMIDSGSGGTTGWVGSIVWWGSGLGINLTVLHLLLISKNHNSGHFEIIIFTFLDHVFPKIKFWKLFWTRLVNWDNIGTKVWLLKRERKERCIAHRVYENNNILRSLSFLDELLIKKKSFVWQFVFLRENTVKTVCHKGWIKEHLKNLWSNETFCWQWGQIIWRRPV